MGGGGESPPASVSATAASYQWFLESCLLGDCPEPSLSQEFHWFAFPQNIADVCLSIPYIFKACKTRRLTPGMALAKLHLAAASDLFSSAHAHWAQMSSSGTLASQNLEPDSEFSGHCLPFLHKPSLHQPDGLKCTLTPTFPVSCRAHGRYSTSVF